MRKAISVRFMQQKRPADIVTLESLNGIWERFFTVSPLVVVGTEEPDGCINLAPKHLAMPLSWQNHFGFVCTPRHRTYHNVKRTGVFTVSYPRPSQVVVASLAASPRGEDGSKPIADTLPTFPASRVKGALLADSYLYLECELQRVYDDFAANSLISGQIIAVHVAQDALRHIDEDDLEITDHSHLLAYLYPGRFCEIAASVKLPFPAGFKR